MKTTALFLLVGLASCGAGSGENETPTGFVKGVDHPYFPLTPNVVRIYEGPHDGIYRREEVFVRESDRTIAGTSCTAVVQNVYLDDILNEVTIEWFAQDAEGNVWKFGEESLELHGGEMVVDHDSWVAGVGDAYAWRAFPAQLQAGDRFTGYSPTVLDQFTIAATDEVVHVAAGSFPGCIRILENPDDPEDGDIILYAPNVGRVSEKHSRGHSDLVEIRRR